MTDFERTSPRYTIVPGEDNKYSLQHKEIQSPDYSATMEVVCESDDTEEVIFGVPLSGDLSLTAKVLGRIAGDKLTLVFPALDADRIVTLGTGFNSASVKVLSGKTRILQFIFDGNKFVNINGLTVDNGTITLDKLAIGTEGDIIYFNGTNWVTLPKGSDGQVLTLASGLPAWASLPG